MSFADHFSGDATDYARFRPTYPDELMRFLANGAPTRGLAWDCGTGSGQAAVALAAEFERVVATDPSAAQLAHAAEHPRVLYRLGRESESGLEEASVDLVTAAQAAHWFDLPGFHREVARVLRPGGLVALWCYGLLKVTPAIDRVLQRFYDQRVGKYWPPERRLIDDEYRTLSFPYERLPVPPMAIEARLDPNELLGYIGTWSAVTRCEREEGATPLPELAAALERLWPVAAERLAVHWPLSVLLGRIAAVR